MIPLSGNAYELFNPLIKDSVDKKRTQTVYPFN